MSTKEQREGEADARKAASAFRMQDSQDRQRVSDERVFKNQPGLLEGQSSSGGDKRGAVYDVSTENTDPKNEQGYTQTISDDSIDRVEATGSASPDGLPEYPGDAPNAPTGILIHDTTTGDPLWAREATLVDADTAEVSILAFNGSTLAKLEGYSSTPGVICQNGLPVDVEILAKFI